jgi:protein subunit release factor A
MIFNLDRLETLSKRFDEIEAELVNSGGAFDQARFTSLVKERSANEPTVVAYRAYRKLLADIASNEELLADKSDPEMHDMAEDEARALRERKHELEAELTELMLPRDPNDTKDVFVEIRAGAGGQHVNKTESAIRITHVPSGIIVSCSEERSQLQNRERAMTMLRSTLADRKRREAEEAVGSLRRSQVGTGDRSEKIRTYNFPQDRITDHRINENFGNVKDVMDGGLGRIVGRLQQDEKSKLLAGETTAA